MTRASRRDQAPQVQLSAETVAQMQSVLKSVGDEVVGSIIAEVPSYAGALSGPMGETIRAAVEVALGGFITLAGRPRRGRKRADLQHEMAGALKGAYELGRGEARSGRSMDALLAAYRIGARVSWQELSAIAVQTGLDTPTVAGFAELVFTYIDELSGASAAGHTDQLAQSGRLRERLLEQVCIHLLRGETEEVLRPAAEQATWTVPETLTAVLVPSSRVRAVLVSLPEGTLVVPDEYVEGLGPDLSLLLVPDMHTRRRTVLVRVLAGYEAVIGPARPWVEVRRSVRRVLAALRVGLSSVDTEEHLAELVRNADAEALEDLRARVLGPLADVRPASRDKLVETLRSWLRHQGRREDVATELFVHPQTVRYRIGQLRELYGDRLVDPEFVRDAIVALG